jgi:hypothetical protein
MSRPRLLALKLPQNIFLGGCLGAVICQQDHATCLTSGNMRTFFEENRLEILDWPGNSPDINPIENLWAIIKPRLLKENCSTMARQ